MSIRIAGAIVLLALSVTASASGLADPSFDAPHLALASYHKCEFLVTWNCQHLANANKFGHICRVNSLLGLYVPVLATPLELLGEEP